VGINPYKTWPKERQDHFNDADREMVAKLLSLPSEVDTLYKTCEFGKAIHLISSIIGDANLYLTTQSPWKLIPKKKDASAEQPTGPLPIDVPSCHHYENKLYICYETLRLSALLLQPIVPTFSNEILTYLGIPPHKSNPLEFGYGVSWNSHSNLETIPDQSLILIDERAKKAEKRANKIERQ
jgi:methionyl-tRNA synthetase